MNVELRRVGKYVGIVIGGERRRPYHHALEDGRAADLGVARGDAREGEIAITAEAKAFFERVGDECRVVDQLLQLLPVRVQQIEGAPVARLVADSEAPQTPKIWSNSSLSLSLSP